MFARTIVQHDFHDGASLMQPSWTVWCNSNERRGEKKSNTPAGKVDWQGKEEEAETLWGMLHTDDAGIASRSPAALER